jgi:hypothetical protein
MSSDNGRSQEGPDQQESAERVADDVARWVGRVVGRAREEAEDMWAEAQTLRQEEGSVMRRGLAYSLAGAIRAGHRIRAVARGAAEGARNASESTTETGGGSGRPGESAEKPVSDVGRLVGDSDG